jgi:hypothetical protein
MQRIQKSLHCPLGYANAFLFCWNIALASKWANAQSESLWPFSYFVHFETRVKYWVNGHLNLNPHSHVGGYSAFFGLAFGLALCFFLLLRVLWNTFLTRGILYILAGPLSLIVLPCYWLFVQSLGPPRPWFSQVSPILLLIELAGAVGGAIGFLYHTAPMQRRECILLAGLTVFHFGFWFWVLFGGLTFWRAPAYLVFPASGLCSVIVWGVYVSQRKDDARSLELAIKNTP